MTVARADDTRERARALFNEGVAAFARGDYAPAYEAFAGAYQLAPHPSVRLNLGHCQEHLGNPVAARDNFRAYLSEAGDISASQRQDVEAAVARVDSHIGHVNVQLFPAGAALFLDDKPQILDNTGGFDVAEGTHVLRAEASASAPVTRSITVAGGSSQTQVFQIVAAPVLMPDPAPAEAASELQPEVTGSAPRGASAHRSLRPWAIAVGAMAVATAAGSLGVGVAARSANSDFEHQVRLTNDPARTPLERAQARQDGLDAVDRTNRLARVSDALLGTTVGLVAVSTVLFVVQARRGRQERRNYSAGFGATRSGAGVSVLGHF